jgi:hypothetical protein
MPHRVRTNGNTLSFKRGDVRYEVGPEWADLPDDVVVWVRNAHVVEVEYYDNIPEPQPEPENSDEGGDDVVIENADEDEDEDEDEDTVVDEVTEVPDVPDGSYYCPRCGRNHLYESRIGEEHRP